MCSLMISQQSPMASCGIPREEAKKERIGPGTWYSGGSSGLLWWIGWGCRISHFKCTQSQVTVHMPLRVRYQRTRCKLNLADRLIAFIVFTEGLAQQACWSHSCGGGDHADSPPLQSSLSLPEFPNPKLTELILHPSALEPKSANPTAPRLWSWIHAELSLSKPTQYPHVQHARNSWRYCLCSGSTQQSCL